jgi:DNA-binding transcriptional ArsR family regulator
MRRERARMTAASGKPKPIPLGDVERFAEVLKALANPARLRIVTILAGGERTVSELCELSGLKQSLVSQQLKILRLNDIVAGRREVPHTYYSLREINVVRMLDCLSRCGRLDTGLNRRQVKEA